jgi:hypothetical protein
MSEEFFIKKNLQSHLHEDEEFQNLCKIILFELTGSVKIQSKVDESNIRHDRILLTRPMEICEEA